jgi:hypothetical protein
VGMLYFLQMSCAHTQQPHPSVAFVLQKIAPDCSSHVPTGRQRLLATQVAGLTYLHESLGSLQLGSLGAGAPGGDACRWAQVTELLAMMHSWCVCTADASGW